MGKRKELSEKLGVAEDAGTRTIRARFRGKAKLLQSKRTPVSSKTFQELNEAFLYLMQNRPQDKALQSKHATVLSADVANYSGMMAANEEETLKFFYVCKEAFEELVYGYDGRVFNTAGDAILSEFESAESAALCAMEIQKELRALNAGQPEGRKILFRMGLNLGEVYINGHDLLGETVNIAARLQTAAVPGGICLSGAVYDLIKLHSPGAIVFLGEKKYKNIPDPIRTYALTDMEGKFQFEESSRITVVKGSPKAEEAARIDKLAAKMAAQAEIAASGRRSGNRILILLLIALVAGGGGYFFAQWRKVPKAAPASAPAGSPGAAPGAALGQMGHVLVSTSPDAEVTFLQFGKEIFKGTTPVTRDFEPGAYKVRIENAQLDFQEEMDLLVEEGKLVRIEKNLLQAGAGAGGANSSAGGLTEAQIAALKGSADQGDVEAEYRLGRHYLLVGSGDTAYEMFRLAATKGHSGAQFELGVLFHTGKGATQDDEASVYWLIKAGLAGNTKAAAYLAHEPYPAEYKRDIENQNRIQKRDFRGADLIQMQKLRLDELKQSLERKGLPV